MSDKIKTSICKYIDECTEQFCTSKKLLGSAQAIAEENFVSRSLISQYLNDMFKSGLLIKINTRPVYFLSRKIIEKTFRIVIKEVYFESPEELLELLDSRLLDRGIFINAIGSDGSLNYCIHQMVSAVSYPPNGLPVLLLGEKGTGKTYLAELLSRYCFNEGIVKEKTLYRYTLSKNESGSITGQRIFGYRDSNKKVISGLLEKSREGVLLIENMQNADEAFVQQLLNYLKAGYYLLGEKRCYSSARIILTAVEQGDIVEILKNELPICCQIPALKERSFKEREALVIEQFSREQKQIHKEIYISGRVFYALIHHHYKNNIKELQSAIVSLCAKAFVDFEDQVYIRSYDLPPVFWENSQFIAGDGDSYVKVDDYAEESQNDSVFIYFEMILNIYREFCSGELSENQFEDECFSRMEDYYNYVIFSRKIHNNYLKTFENALKRIVDSIFNQYQIFLPASFVYVLAKAVYNLAYNNGAIQVWQDQHMNELMALLRYFEERFSSACEVAGEISRWIKQEMDVELDVADFLFILLNTHYYNMELESIKYHCLIAAHGYSTASSMADTVNKITGVHIFDGIDMPLDASFQSVKVLIRDYLKKYTYKKDIILLVDMGSLEQLDDLKKDFKDRNLGIINNVNTRMALDIAGRVKQEQELKQIIQECAEDNISLWRFHPAASRPASIIFATEIGEKATERVLQLFKSSIPRNIELLIIPYSYNKLLQNGNRDEVFANNQVILIVGMTEIKGLDVPFVSLEDMITFSDFELIANVLAPYMSREEMEIFNSNMLKNFSLVSILDNVTILNATKLYEKIARAIDLLERQFTTLIPNKIKVGMYIHISCLVERQVLRETEKTYIGGEENSREVQRFAKVFKNCFAEVMNYYRIEFPVNEIAYFYSIVKPYI